MDNDYSWDERIDDFMSVLHNKNNKSISTNKAFSNLSLLSILVISFFLENDEEKITKREDIFTRIKDRVKLIISQEIIDTEMDQQIKNFKPIKELLLEYLVIQERDLLLSNIVKKCDLFFENLLISEKNFHLIPFTITFAIVHLTVLREFIKLKTPSLVFSLLYSDVEIIISLYQNYFSDSFHQFFTWRINQITTKTSISNDLTSSSLFSFHANGEVRDKISNKLVNYVAKSSNDQIFLKVFDLIKLRMFNEAKAEFMKIFLHVFSLVKFFPEIPWPFNIKSFWVGPYGIDTYPDGSHNLDDNYRFLYNISEDDPGLITKIIIRHGSLIDSIQAYYKDDRNDQSSRAGKKIGGTAGENECIISDLDNHLKYIVAINLKFGRGLLTVIEFTFNDGISTRPLGIPNVPITDTLQIGPFGNHNEFRLSGINGGGGKIENKGVYVAHIAFQFQYVDSL
ncbi:17744_t:CDS:1 [Funneliformis caledonium]|uniref:17744_t:CDS:1 n=1 Tax=Funneliformis caledonium TaxID=1117310 RepID=A0A9N8Z8J6_9GLOM|nr:17744_t:CDS:1 [Funneliformis caledonium]